MQDFLRSLHASYSPEGIFISIIFWFVDTGILLRNRERKRVGVSVIIKDYREGILSTIISYSLIFGNMQRCANFDYAGAIL